MQIEVRLVDYEAPTQAQQLVELINQYAIDPMGGGTPLSKDVQNRLVPEMKTRSFIFSAIAYAQPTNQAVGVINFIEGFSTFAAQSLINVHDVYVVQEFRGLGIAKQMFEFVELEAKRLGCCKMTLEVLEKNKVACAAYRNFGFQPYSLSDAGPTQFWQKQLT